MAVNWMEWWVVFCRLARVKGIPWRAAMIAIFFKKNCPCKSASDGMDCEEIAWKGMAQ